MAENQIRVSFMITAPFLNENCSGIHYRPGPICESPGVAVELLYLITTYLNLTINKVKVIEHVTGWANVHEEMENDLTDTYALLFGENSPEYKDSFEFSQVVFSSNVKMITRRVDQSLKGILDFFSIYSKNVWISIFCVFLLFTAFGLLVRYVEFKLKLREKCKFGEILWKMSRLQLMQFEEIRYRLIAGRSSLLIFSLFQMCILCNLFQSLILTILYKRLHLAPFSDDEAFRLITAKKLKLVVANRTLHWLDNDMQQNYDLKTAIQSNPYTIVESPFETISNGYEGVTLVGEYSWYKWQNSFCNLMAIEENVGERPLRFMFKKGSRFTPLFKEAIEANKYEIRQITQKYRTYQAPSKCELDKGVPLPLSQTPYYGILLTFSVGMICACIVFGGELLKPKDSVVSKKPLDVNKSFDLIMRHLRRKKIRPKHLHRRHLKLK